MKAKFRHFYKGILTILVFIFVAFPCAICAYIAKIFVRDLWIIQEDGTSARDNAYHLFKYIRENHPEQKIIFIIKKSSPEYERVRALGKVCGYQSIAHWFYYYLCSKEISTHPHNKPWYHVSRYLWLNKTYFLQHGVIRDFLLGYTAEMMPLKLFITTAYDEDKYVRENFHHKDEVVRLLGIARHDNLLGAKVNYKQILVMPTYRSYLYRLSDEQFKESDYFKHWQGIINNEQLLENLKQNDITLIFYLHRSFHNYLHNFTSISENVIVAQCDKYDVQELLKESSLLVTDYSSVFFDFAYMKKPVVWYTFDRKQYFSEHHTKGYFDEESSGLGVRVEEENNLVNTIIENINKKFQLAEQDKEAITKFYAFFDGKNCERNYNAIRSIK